MAWNCEPRRRDGLEAKMDAVPERIGQTASNRMEKEGAVADQAKLRLSDEQDEMQFALERKAKENVDFIEWESEQRARHSVVRAIYTPSAREVGSMGVSCQGIRGICAAL